MRLHPARLALLLLATCGGDDNPASTADAGVVADGPIVIPDAKLPSADAMRATMLSKAGLYSDFKSGTIDPSFIYFEPRYKLWSDAAEKRRWVRLPPGTKIDTSDMDRWVFPIGTQFFKEFKSEGKLVETRLVERLGDGDYEYWMGAFVWLDDESDAVFQPMGAENIRGTQHDAPAADKCWACHGGEPGRGLGFSAVQLSAATIADLTQRGLFTNPPPGEFKVPGDATVSTALGYLHANCGHCHNEYGVARPSSDQILRLDLADTTPETTTTYRTTIGKHTMAFLQMPYRIVAGDPDMSAVAFRMSTRGDMRQMPPLATEFVDPVGVAAVRAWIAGLPH
jgi:hypothetical protein